MNWMLMPLRRYADFSGRSRRMEFWAWLLLQVLIGIGYWILVFAIAGAGVLSGDLTGMSAAGGAVLLISGLYLLVGLIFFIPGLAVSVRRLHDSDRSGWWILGPLIPYVLMLALFFGAAASFGPKPDEATVASFAMVFLILLLVMMLMGLIVIIFMLLDGTRGPNKYGPDPKAPVPVGVFS